ATQNPVEFHGTYPLPEAQLDRFSMKLQLGYPDPEDELSVLEGQRLRHPLEDLQPVASLEEVAGAQAEVRAVKVDRSVSRYILSLVQATRQDARLKLGSSPRGALALYRCGQSLALCSGRDYCLPDDVKQLAVPVLAHRLVLDTKAKYSGASKDTIVTELLEQVRVPT
ncbi:MAG: MoxR family ATPase, partial [Candidatus Eremiobacterota bacterium]